MMPAPLRRADDAAADVDAYCFRQPLPPTPRLMLLPRYLCDISLIFLFFVISQAI